MGISKGKKINAVDDVTHKLRLARSTHVCFLLIRVEACCNSGDHDIQEFISLASLNDDNTWKHKEEPWTHPRDPAYRFHVHLWVRSLS